MQELNPNLLTIFTVDNVDFLHSYVQVYAGNQHLSWHERLSKLCRPNHHSHHSHHKQQPSQNDDRVLINLADPESAVRRRPHSMLSPLNSPNKGGRSPTPKRFHGHSRTGTEFTPLDPTNTYHFQHHSNLISTNGKLTLSTETFRPSLSELASVKKFLTQILTACLRMGL